MSDTDKRFAKALSYLSNLSADLGHDVTAKTAQWNADQKDLISLSGSSAWRKGSDEQHIAVRALLLCTMIYYRAPHAAMQLVDDAALKLIRDKMLGKTRAFIDDEIRLYVRAPAPTKDDLTAAAERVCYPVGNVTGYLRTRADTNLGTGPVCYNGTSTWLFAAGFVSRRWLAKEGSQMLDKTARGFLGEGALIGGRGQWAPSREVISSTSIKTAIRTRVIGACHSALAEPRRATTQHKPPNATTMDRRCGCPPPLKGSSEFRRRVT